MVAKGEMEWLGSVIFVLLALMVSDSNCEFCVCYTQMFHPALCSDIAATLVFSLALPSVPLPHFPPSLLSLSSKHN